jgi:hypothetical protein
MIDCIGTGTKEFYPYSGWCIYFKNVPVQVPALFKNKVKKKKERFYIGEKNKSKEN